jgi:phosphatidylglycerophosphate synthase
MLVMPWQLPQTPLLGRVLVAQLLGVAAATAVAILLGQAIPATRVYPLKAALVFFVISAVAIGYLRGQHPFTRFGAANVATTGRAVLVSVAAALVGEARTDAVAWAAAAIGLVATLLDGVDGWLARRTGMASTFGARYDMEVDALLIMALALLAWQHDKAGAWILLAGAMRYLFVAAGYVWHWLDAPLPPSMRRKAVCVVQIAGLGVVVSPFVASPMSVVCAAATLAALVWSFGLDVLWLRRHGA